MGFFILATKKLGLVLIGVWLGVTIGILLYNGVLYIMEIDATQVFY